MSNSDVPPALRQDALSALPGVKHGFTLRAHGRSARESLGAVLGTALQAWTVRELQQVHGAEVAVVGVESPEARPRPRADALVTAEPGELLVVSTADCLPVLLVGLLFGEPVVAAAIHVGWKGLVAGVLDRALERVERLAPTARLRAALGPSIGPCCFEVGAEVAERIAEAAGAGVLGPGRGERPHADLPGAASRLLAMREVEVHGAPQPCTRCRPDLYHSHRAEGAAAGRMAAFVGFRAPC